MLTAFINRYAFEIALLVLTGPGVGALGGARAGQDTGQEPHPQCAAHPLRAPPARPDVKAR